MIKFLSLISFVDNLILFIRSFFLNKDFIDTFNFTFSKSSWCFFNNTSLFSVVISKLKFNGFKR